MKNLLKFYLPWLLALSFVATSATAQEEQTTESATMTVTATRTATDIREAPGAITVITSDEIADSASRDLVDILAESPGISLLGHSVGGRKTISIRGSSDRHTLMLIDGRRIAASDAVMGHSNFENSWVSTQDIERIEVVRGPLSALYGSEALGGVVNIITRPPTQQWAGSFTLGGGVPDDKGGESSNMGVSISGPIVVDKVGITLGVEYLHENATPDEDNPQYSELEGREILSFNSKLTFTPVDDQRFELFANIIDEERDYLSSSRGRDTDYTYELDKYMFGASWSGKIGPTESTINFYRSRIDKVSIKTYLDTNVTSEAPDKVTNDIVDFHTSLPVAFNLFTLGGEYRLESVEADSLSDIGGEEEVTHKSLFIQDEIALFGDRLLLTPGLRYDHHEYFGSEFSSRFYALLKVTENIHFKAGYGQAFNAPTAKQLSPGYNASTGPHSFIGNPDVDAERADSYEAGVEYFGSKVTAKLFLFYNEIDDLIAYDKIGSTGPGGRFGIYQADNIDEATIKGIEAELSAQLSQSVNLTLGYNYLDAEDSQNDTPLSGRPEHTVNCKLKHHAQSIGLDSVFRYQYVGNQSFENDDEKMERVAGYSLWHTSFTKALTQHLDLQLGIDNISDVRLVDESDLFMYEQRGRYIYTNLKGSF